MQKEFKDLEEKDLENIGKEVFNFVESYFENQNRIFASDKRVESLKSCVIFLNGDLGAGKTTFTKYFAKVLGINENVISPTFILRKDYDFINGTLIHIDGYRFENKEEAKVLALDQELFTSLSKDEGAKKIILIEWSEKFKDYYNLIPDLEINIQHKSENERDILMKY